MKSAEAVNAENSSHSTFTTTATAETTAATTKSSTPKNATAKRTAKAKGPKSLKRFLYVGNRHISVTEIDIYNFSG